MSTKKRGIGARHVVTPLAIIGGKQKVGKDASDEVAQLVLCHFDAAKRGQCDSGGAHVLSANLVMAQCIAAWTQSRAFYDRTAKAILQLGRACARQPELVSLTTGEYRDIREALSWYLRALPNVESAMFAKAEQRAHEVLDETQLAA